MFAWLHVWRQGSRRRSFKRGDHRHADGTLASTDWASANRGWTSPTRAQWGYHPLLVSLANTGEPLYLVPNRSGNRPSVTKGAAAQFDRAIALCRRAGFKHDPAAWGHGLHPDPEHWIAGTRAGVRFIFGIRRDAPNLVTHCG